MNVLSLFDGLGGAKLALDSLNIPCTYYASEIDPYAIKVAKYNYPDIIHLGDVKGVGINSNLPEIDLLVGGSPCLDLSIAKRNGKGLAGEQSGLFYEYVRILQEIKPRYFLLENVASMKQQDRDKITEIMGVKPIMINSSLVTAQQRKRLYWTNIEGVTQPVDRKIYLRDILEYGYTEKIKSYPITATYSFAISKDYFIKKQRQLIFNKPVRIGTIGKGGQAERIYYIGGKSISLQANSGGGGGKTGLYEFKDHIRKLTPLEAERLQGIPEKERIFHICIDEDCQKNYVNVEVLNHKLRLHVGNVEKKDLLDNVKYAVPLFNIKNQPIKKPVQVYVLVNCEAETVELHSQSVKLKLVNNVESSITFPLLEIKNFVQSVVKINTILEKIVIHGGEELHHKDKPFVQQGNGNSVVDIFGKGITQLVNDVKNDLTTHNKLLKFTTLNLFGQENNNWNLQILCLYVVAVIFGYIPKEIYLNNSLKLSIIIKQGYTYGISNNQRYKMIGNGFTIPVIAHILSFMGKVADKVQLSLF